MRIAKGLLGLLLTLPMLAAAEEIGEVSTVFKWLGPNDKRSEEHTSELQSP